MMYKRKFEFIKIQNLMMILTLIYFNFSCSISKHVPENKYLIKDVEIEINNSSSDLTLDTKDFYEIIKQKPNRKILSKFRFYLRIYNLSNQDRIDKRSAIKQNKIDLYNLKKQNKYTKDSILKSKEVKERPLTFGEKIQRAGEAPVVLENYLTQRTTTQLKNFLFNKGYFNAIINDSIVYLKNRQVSIIYKISSGPVTTVENIKYQCFDKGIIKYLDTIKDNSIISKGDYFDTYKLTEERNNVTTFLQNRGFYSFNKEFIFYELDTMNRDNNVEIKFGIQNYKKFDENKNKIVELPHQQFKINNVYVNISSSFSESKLIDEDSVSSKSLIITNYQPIKYQKRIIKKSILFKKNQFYSKYDAQGTYKRLIGLNLFKSVSLNFDTINNSQLNGIINLIPRKTQGFGISIDGTNSEGVYGTEGSISYNHNNLFHGGENFLFSIKGGLETQLLYSDTIETNNTFNTLEIGPEFKFLIPKYFLINKFKNLKNHINSRTEITGSINYQQRPDFTRWNQEFSFGWVFHENKAITWHINPLLISVVDIDLDPLYELQINSLNDQFIATSFLDHIITGGLFSFEYNSQNLNITKRDFYAKATFESAGGALFRFHELIGKVKDSLTNTYYNLLNIRYSHFQKLSLDLRYYQPILFNSKFVYRLFAGIGIPNKNQIEALPFEKSFFSGGSNGMRAWKVRSLGPGAYYDSSLRYDKIGDIKLEGNLEARFPISDFIEGAVFLDMGNVWLLRYDSLRANGQFKWNSFADQIAFGAGIGLRLNLDFFIVRADLAIPLKNPVIPYNESNINLTSAWIFKNNFSDRKQFHPLQFNIGIGYPF